VFLTPSHPRLNTTSNRVLLVVMLKVVILKSSCDEQNDTVCVRRALHDSKSSSENRMFGAPSQHLPHRSRKS
jgi:hypothetical protein